MSNCRTALALDTAVEQNDYQGFHEIITMSDQTEGVDLLFLHRASAFGFPITLEFLLQTGFYDVNESDCNGCTPLHVAASASNPDSVSRLS